MKKTEIYMMIMGSVLILGLIVLIIVLYLFPAKQENNDLLYIAVGGLIGQVSNVVGYYFGSSLGSQRKTEILNNNNGLG